MNDGGGTLYHDAILALARSREGAGRLPEPDVSVTIDNPLCGDRVTIDLALDGGMVTALAHRVRGCALCEAAAAAISRHAAGLDSPAIEAASAAADAILRGEAPPAGSWPEIALFVPVAAHRSRHRCVTLPFEAVREALRKAGGGA
ncbi:MAG TPA: iron-sulfur cluster assembly scaffold protein [Stellaceae bacterium]